MDELPGPPPLDPGRAALAAEHARDRRCICPAPVDRTAPTGTCTDVAVFAVCARWTLADPTRVLYTPCRAHAKATVDLPGLIVEAFDPLNTAVVMAVYRLVSARRGELGRRAQFAARAAGDTGDPLWLMIRTVEQMERLADVDIGAMKMPDEAATTVTPERTPNE